LSSVRNDKGLLHEQCLLLLMLFNLTEMQIFVNADFRG
jgi:hypothetical protein